MDPDTLVWLWLVAGGLLVASELIVPGLITIFLGISALAVALCYKFGVLEGILSGFTTWFITSLFSIFCIREFIKKLLPGDSSFKKVNEDLDAYGEIVEVIEDIRIDDAKGRIKFRGTTWQATAAAPLISAGSKAKIVARDNLVWIVEPYEESLLDEMQVDSET